jgi:hypothetical protein
VIEGGNLADDARERYEIKLNEKEITSKNFLNLNIENKTTELHEE